LQSVFSEQILFHVLEFSKSLLAEEIDQNDGYVVSLEGEKQGSSVSAGISKSESLTVDHDQDWI
jgi:hypothetical protein